MAWNEEPPTKGSWTHPTLKSQLGKRRVNKPENVISPGGEKSDGRRNLAFIGKGISAAIIVTAFYQANHSVSGPSIEEQRWHAQNFAATQKLQEQGIYPQADVSDHNTVNPMSAVTDRQAESTSNDRFKEAKRIMSVKPYNALGHTLVVDQLLKVLPGTTHYDEAQKILARMQNDVKRFKESSEEFKLIQHADDLAKGKHYSEALQALSEVHKGMQEFKYAQVERADILADEKQDELDAREANAPKLDAGSVTIACRDAIRPQARFPSKADFSLFKESINQSGSTTRMVGEVELMNGIGNMIPAKFFCTFKGTALTSAILVQE